MKIAYSQGKINGLFITFFPKISAATAYSLRFEVKRATLIYINICQIQRFLPVPKYSFPWLWEDEQ